MKNQNYMGIEKPKRILIIDPDGHYCDTLEEILANAGYLVYTAVNCMEGEKLSTALKPHISIMDEHLPDGTVNDLINMISKVSPDCHYIVQTSRQSENHPDNSCSNGICRYLVKTSAFEMLLEMLTHVSEIVDLRNEKHLTEASLLKRNRELEDINERLRQIVESTRRLTSFSGSGDIGPVILHEFAGNMNARGGSLFLHRNNELILAYSLDKNHVPERIPLPLKNKSVMNMVLMKNEPVLIEDIRTEMSFHSSGYNGYSDHSLLAFPLLEKHGAIVGIITLHDKIMPPFTRQDKELGAILASYGSETLRATQAIENLRQSEEKARIILEANPDPVAVFDNEKKVRYFNPAFTRVFGWTLEEKFGTSMDDFVPEKGLADYRLMERMEEEGENYTGIETIRYSKSGTVIPVSISGATFSDNSGEVMGSVRNYRDITSRKILESQLIQSQKMEAIGTLASGIAHDFNNILSAIFGNLDLAMMDLPEGLSIQKNIQNISKAAHRAKDLVSQILSFSRKSTMNGIDAQKAKIHPHLIIKEALSLLRASLPSTIEIKEKIFDKTGTIQADPTQFHQVIMNLCTNAHHAMLAEGGTLTVTLEKTGQVGDDKDVNPISMVKLSIEDTGCGMDEETVKRIFDPYFTTKDKHMGTGLGLSVVRKIVEDLKGGIAVFSQPGEGTRFELIFPDAGEAEKKKGEQKSTLDKGSGKILFVDDEKDIANLSVSLLNRLGYTVDALTSPVEALEQIMAAPDTYDMVITDLTMPKMTGIVLAGKIRAVRPDMPIILCTGLNESDIRSKTPENAVNAILRKPADLRDFSEAIAPLMNKKSRPVPMMNNDAPHFPVQMPASLLNSSDQVISS